jgi:hypothetical protein
MTGSPENPDRRLALPDQIACSGMLDCLIDTVRGYADHAVAENTRRACTRVWSAFAR